MPKLLNLDPKQIERMEVDLATKAAQAFQGTDVAANVHGVFSLDDLENKLESDLQSKVGIGIAYNRTVPLALEPHGAVKSAAPGHGLAAKTLQHEFIVILAVPTGENCTERYTATELLTRLRMGIHGSVIDSAEASRRWNFISERANTEASTDTMLYYSQVWQVALQLIGQAS